MHGSVGPPGFLLRDHSASLEVSRDQQTRAPLLRISLEIRNMRGMACCPGCMCLAHGNPSLQGPITGSFLIISSLASQSQHGGWNRGLTDSSTLTTAASMDALCFSFLVCTVGSVKPTLQECFEEWGVYVKYLNLAVGQQKWVSPKYEPQKATCALWTSRHRWICSRETGGSLVKEWGCRGLLKPACAGPGLRWQFLALSVHGQGKWLRTM